MLIKYEETGINEGKKKNLREVKCDGEKTTECKRSFHSKSECVLSNVNVNECKQSKKNLTKEKMDLRIGQHFHKVDIKK